MPTDRFSIHPHRRIIINGLKMQQHTLSSPRLGHGDAASIPDNGHKIRVADAGKQRLRAKRDENMLLQFMLRGLVQHELKEHILVPFCPESLLSGIGNTDFMPVVWYRRSVTVPQSWAGQRVLLHFQAIDYDATVWVNGEPVGRHRGGFTPFTCDLGDIAASGDPITIVLRARDDPCPS